MTMLELAQSIAYALRAASNEIKCSVRRYKRSDAQVTVTRGDDQFTFDVLWTKGGAVVWNYRYYKSEVSKQFDFDAIITRVVERIAERKKSQDRYKERQAQRKTFKQIVDAVRHDPRFSANFDDYGDTSRPYSFCFRANNETTLSMAIDILMESGLTDTNEPPPTKPTLNDARYELRLARRTYDEPQLTLRDIARIDHVTDEVFAQVVTMCIDTHVVLSDGSSIYRVS